MKCHETFYSQSVWCFVSPSTCSKHYWDCDSESWLLTSLGSHARGPAGPEQSGLQDVVSKVLVMWRTGVQEDHELPVHCFGFTDVLWTWGYTALLVTCCKQPKGWKCSYTYTMSHVKKLWEDAISTTNVHLLLVRLWVICVPHIWSTKSPQDYYDIWSQFLCTLCFSVVPHYLNITLLGIP